MMENILVSIILAVCSGDTKVYTVQDQKVSCYEYYVNCVVNKQGTWGTKDLDWCVENSK
jgi:hypothetical protein